MEWVAGQPVLISSGEDNGIKVCTRLDCLHTNPYILLGDFEMITHQTCSALTLETTDIVQAQVVRFITGPYGDNILVFAFPSAGVVLGVNGDPLNSSLPGIVGIIGSPR